MSTPEKLTINTDIFIHASNESDFDSRKKIRTSPFESIANHFKSIFDLDFSGYVDSEGTVWNRFVLTLDTLRVTEDATYRKNLTDLMEYLFFLSPAPENHDTTAFIFNMTSPKLMEKGAFAFEAAMSVKDPSEIGPGFEAFAGLLRRKGVAQLLKSKDRPYFFKSPGTNNWENKI